MKGVWESNVDSKFCVMSGVDLEIRLSDRKNALVSGVGNTPFMGPNHVMLKAMKWHNECDHAKRAVYSGNINSILLRSLPKESSV